MSLKPAVLQTTLAETLLPRDLGGGLVLRSAIAADSEPLAQFNGRIHGRDHFDPMVAAWTRNLISESHPSCGPSNITVVEDTNKHTIVSSMCLIPQTWTYAGIPFQVGRPEAVGTDPAYRRRGLVRAQFEVHHRRSAAMGHHVQAITGIPWYYRQFGYEYALDLGGGRFVDLASIPPLKTGENERYRVRAMTADDVPFAARLYDRDAARWLVACPRPDWLWRHMLFGYSEDSFANRPFRIVENVEGQRVGYLAPSREMDQEMYVVNEIAAAPGQSLRDMMPAVFRVLCDMAHARAAELGKTVTTLYFQLGPDHPLYAAIPEMLTRERKRYGWYIRVDDVRAFLAHIAPALDERLARSPMAGFTSDLKINEYTRGMRLVFEKGKFVAAEEWQPGEDGLYKAAFPPGVFLQLLFGFSTLAELRTVFPDCLVRADEAVLLEALFPKQHSHVIAVD